MTGPEETPDGPGLSAHSSVESVRALYDRWAGLYDWNPVLDLVRPARRHAVSAMALLPGDTVVDMGTGTGANLPHLRDAVGPEGMVIGIDVSPRMLRRARRLVKSEGWENVALIEGDIRDPPLDGPVDAILSAFVVVMYDDPGELIETWATLIDDGSMANLFAGRSAHSSAPLMNRLLGAYLRLFEDGWNTAGERKGPLEILAERGDTVRAAMESHTDRVEHEEFVFGLAHLEVGHLAE